MGAKYAMFIYFENVKNGEIFTSFETPEVWMKTAPYIVNGTEYNCVNLCRSCPDFLINDREVLRLHDGYNDKGGEKMTLKTLARQKHTSCADIINCLNNCPPRGCSKCPLYGYDCVRMNRSKWDLFDEYKKHVFASTRDYTDALLNMPVILKETK